MWIVDGVLIGNRRLYCRCQGRICGWLCRVQASVFLANLTPESRSEDLIFVKEVELRREGGANIFSLLFSLHLLEKGES